MDGTVATKADVRTEETPAVVSGNAYRDRNHRHWLVGWFIEDSPLRSDPRVEIKWGTLAKGERREVASGSRVATSLAILLSGRMRMSCDGRDHLLENMGDYVLWSENVFHTWEALEEVTVITIRWPSIAGQEVTR